MYLFSGLSIKDVNYDPTGLSNLKRIWKYLKSEPSIIGNVGRKPDINIDVGINIYTGIPFDVILQILSRLPTKSLCRFKCVCKSWDAAIQDRNFNVMHMKRRPKIIELYKEKISDNIGHNKLWDKMDGLMLEESLSRKQYLLSNVVTKKTIIIPHPHKLIRHIMFTYVQSIKSYKLVHVYGKKGNEVGGCKVLTIGTDVGWRSLDIPILHSFRDGRERTTSMKVHEVFYIFRFFTTDTHLSEIVYVDMGNEHFGSIKIPQGYSTEGENVGIVHWEDRLALAHQVNQTLHLWILDDYKKQKWAESNIVVSLSFLTDNPHLKTPNPLYTVRGGWLSYVHEEYFVSFHIKSKRLHVKCAPSGNVYYGRFSSSLVSLYQENIKDKL